MYEDAIQFSLELENLSGQDIRAFEGTLAFYDLLDNLILRSKLTITDPIKAAGKLTWDGQIGYNQFRYDHRRLASSAHASCFSRSAQFQTNRFAPSNRASKSTCVFVGYARTW